MFHIKEEMTCESRDLVYLVIFTVCNEEYIGDTGKRKARVRDRVRVYKKHIWQMLNEKLKCGGKFQTREKGEFKIFPFLNLHLNNKYLRQRCEK